MSKQEEIKQALAAASTEHEWDTDGTFIQWKDGHVLQGTYRQIAITEAPNPEVFDNPNHENDANLIAKAPEYIDWLLKLEQSLQEDIMVLKDMVHTRNVENERLRKELEEARKQIKEAKTEKAILEGELSQANAYKHFEAERTKEAVQLHKSFEEARYALNAIQMGEWSCSHDENGLEVWTTRRINPGQIAREALGQEGEGNHEPTTKYDG